MEKIGKVQEKGAHLGLSIARSTLRRFSVKSHKKPINQLDDFLTKILDFSTIKINSNKLKEVCDFNF